MPRLDPSSERQRGAARPGPLLGLALLLALGLAAGLLLRGGGPGEGRVVVVYTAHGQDALSQLVPRFERERGVRVEVVKLGSGEVMQRALAERGAPRCDVIWSIAGDQLDAHRELLEPLRPAEAAAIVSGYLPAAEAGWLPYSVLVPVLLVNTQLLAPDARPRSWAALADPALQDRIASARADTSGSAFIQLATILRQLGEAPEGPGWSLIDALLERSLLSGSSSAVPRLVNDGEAAVGLTLEHSARRYLLSGGPVEIVYPSEGTCAAPDGIALVRGAPHRAEGEAFVAWALSQSTQAFLVEELGRRSVRADVPPPSGLPDLAEARAQPYDFAWAGARQEGILARWRARVAALGK